MVGDLDHRPKLIDFFAHTPRAKTAEPEFYAALADFGTTTQTFHIGNGASAAPGFVPGLFHLHAVSGSLPMDQLIAPAALAAADGVEITDYQHLLSTVVAPILKASAASRNVFAPEGDFPPPGSRFQNPQLAGLLELLAEGRDEGL